MYVVLAKNATMTIVCIGWREARYESACSNGVTFLFNHIGPAAVSVVPPGVFDRRKDEPSMLRIREISCSLL
jgi:hypothetical protein